MRVHDRPVFGLELPQTPQEAGATVLLLRAVREDAKDRTVEALRRETSASVTGGCSESL